MIVLKWVCYGHEFRGRGGQDEPVQCSSAHPAFGCGHKLRWVSK